MGIEQVYIGSVFIAGLFSFFSPCILPLLPVYFAYIGGTDSERPSPAIRLGKMRIHPLAMVNTLFFMLGLSTVFVLLGFGAGAFGGVINNRWFTLICGIVVMLFGIYHTGLFKWLFMERERKWTIDLSGKRGIPGAFLLGFTFSFGWTPCIGPVLAAVLGISAGEGSAAFGGLLMLTYTLGLTVPFLLLALFSDVLLRSLRKTHRHMVWIKAISGILLTVMGWLLMTNQLNAIANIFNP